MPTPKGTPPWNKSNGKGWTDKRGYRWRRVLCSDGIYRQRREHRVVMEEFLGRPLEPWEIVHHKDGDTLNNDIENLAVTNYGDHTSEHHKGSRRDADARRSVEAFAHIRHELERYRKLNTELHAALTQLVAEFDKRATVFPASTEDAIEVARAALAKARGEEPPR